MFLYKQYLLNENKELRCTLQLIYGIGLYKSLVICSKYGISYPFLFKYLNSYNKAILIFILDFYTWLEIRLKRIIYANIRKYYEIQSYKGLRHKDNLPVRGQRTRSNAKTKKRFKMVWNE